MEIRNIPDLTDCGLLSRGITNALNLLNMTAKTGYLISIENQKQLTTYHTSVCPYINHSKHQQKGSQQQTCFLKMASELHLI